MSKPCSAALVAFLLFGSAHAQRVAEPAGKTLEGFWQDTARRILYSREAPPSYAYGLWTLIDQAQTQTYPAAKEVRRSGSDWVVLDLSFDDANYSVKTIAAREQSLEFIRTVTWSGCVMHHKCSLHGEEMICALENVCPKDGQSVVDWRGEERYGRRASCERVGRAELLGIPVSCR